MSSQMVSEGQIYAALRKCMDPEIPVNVVDLGLIYDVKVKPAGFAKLCAVHRMCRAGRAIHLGQSPKIETRANAAGNEHRARQPPNH